MVHGKRIIKRSVGTGKRKALAVTGPRRLPIVPDTPTLAQAANLAGFDPTIRWGIVAPAGTPEPIGQGPEHFANYLRTETPPWAERVKRLNLRTD